MSRIEWTVALCGLIAVGQVLPAVASQRDRDPIVFIRVENAGGIRVPALAWAQELASQTFARASVVLHWTLDEAAQPDRSLTLIVTTSVEAPRGVAVDAMGLAPSPGDGTRGTLAYVFLDKVTAFAARYRLAEAHVLACALAHEIGHLLLPPNAHRPDGIMRDSWHPALFPPRVPGIPGFPIDQARLLRLRARRQ